MKATRQRREPTERSLSSYRDGEPVMLTHTVTREQFYAPARRRSHGHNPTRTRRTAPVRDIMATPSVASTTSSAADWKSIMAAAKGQALGVGE